MLSSPPVCCLEATLQALLLAGRSIRSCIVFSRLRCPTRQPVFATDRVRRTGRDSLSTTSSMRSVCWLASAPRSIAPFTSLCPDSGSRIGAVVSAFELGVIAFAPSQMLLPSFHHETPVVDIYFSDAHICARYVPAHRAGAPYSRHGIVVALSVLATSPRRAPMRSIVMRGAICLPGSCSLTGTTTGSGLLPAFSGRCCPPAGEQRRLWRVLPMRISPLLPRMLARVTARIRLESDGAAQHEFHTSSAAHRK